MIPIVFSTDHNFVMPTGVAIFSMLECALDTDFDIFVLQANDVTDEDRMVLQEMVSRYSSSISFLSMGEYFHGAFEIRGISKASYYRLLIPWLIPQYDKVIYSDGDVIFLDNIKELYVVSLEDDYVAGFCPNEIDKDAFKDYAPLIGVKAKEYINGGILLINSKKQREDRLDDEYLKLAKNRYVYQDQDIINIVCKHHISHVSMRYNCPPDKGHLNGMCVIHYLGKKPWKAFTHSWMRWWDVYCRSPFYNEVFELEVADKILNPVYTQRQLAGLFMRKTMSWVMTMRKKIQSNNYVKKSLTGGGEIEFISNALSYRMAV